MTITRFKYLTAVFILMVKQDVKAHDRKARGKPVKVKAYDRNVKVTPKRPKRPIIKKGPAKGGPTFFFEPRYERLAELISIESPASAKLTVAELERYQSQAGLRRTIWAANLAANRAMASLKRERFPLSAAEKAEMPKVAQIYRAYSKRASAQLAGME